MSKTNTARWLLRFHSQAGVRVALRTMAPAVGLLVAAGVLTGDPMLVIAAVAALLFPARVSILASLLATALFFGVATAAHSRLATGLSGWIRHLPAASRTHQLTATAGLVLAQGPVIAIMAAAGLLDAADHPALAVCRLLGLPLLAWAAAAAAVTVDSRWRRWSSLAAGVAAMTGSWWLLLAGAAALALLQTPPARRRPASHSRARSLRRAAAGRRAAPLLATALTLSWRITWRAGRWRLLAPAGLATLTLVPAALFINNNELAPHHAVGAVRLAMMTGAVLAMVSLAETIRMRRPPWPWARSLPWSAARRALFDAAVLAACWVPPAVVGALIRPQALVPILLSTPFLALRGAAAIRTNEKVLGSPSGELLLEGGLAAMLVALLPWLSLLLLVASPWALHLAAAAGRRQMVSLWDELDHLATGDPQSWRGT